MAITKEKIIETAEKLQAEGVNPTQTNVREALGGGSFATIGPVLKAWKETEQADHALAEVHIPESIADRLEQLQGALWKTAISEAERRLASEREALKEAQEKAIGEVAEANEAVETLESEQEELKNQLSASADEIHKVQSELAEYKNKVMNLREEMARETSERTAKIESLAATVTELRTALSKSEKRSESLETKLEQRQERHQEELEIIRKDHKSEIESTQTEHREALANEARKLESLEGEVKGLTTARNQALSRSEAAEKELEQHRSTTAKIREKLESAQKEASELRGELKAINAQKEQ
jgi:chromosome segregation ATPase